MEVIFPWQMRLLKQFSVRLAPVRFLEWLMRRGAPR